MQSEIQVQDLRSAEVEKTLEEAHKLMLKHKRCLVVRPTGFGKSYMLAKLSHRFEKTLYVYPTEIIKISMQEDYKDLLHETYFASYRALLEKYKRGELLDYLIQNNFKAIMFDEVHQIGASNFRNTYEDIETVIRAYGVCIIGASATPDRMDSFDYQTDLFHNIEVYEYTLHDCIVNGLMLKPHYVHSQFDVEKDKSAFDIAVAKLRKAYRGDMAEFESFVSQKQIEIANILNASKVIKKHIKSIYGDPSYLKFIVFFSSIQNLNDTYKDVTDWFSDAFPDLSVNTLIVTSESDKRSNVELVDTLKYQEGRIDLIMCVDMLNMGYHVDTITGIVMIRGTSSDIVYRQQIGRCMNVRAKYPSIIFDFVNNYKKLPYFVDGKNKEGSGRAAYKESAAPDIGIQDLVMEDNVASYIDLMKRIARIHIKIREKEIIWLYKSRNMPMYFIAERLGMKKSEIQDILTNNKVALQDESYLNLYCKIDKRRLYIARGK